MLLIWLIARFAVFAKNYSQDSQWNYIDLKLPVLLKGEKLLIQLLKEINSPAVLLTATYNKEPFFFYDSSIRNFENNFDFYDFKSWVLNEPNSFLSISYKFIQEIGGNNIIIGVYKDTDILINYEIDVHVIKDLECYFKCSSDSECKNGECLCVDYSYTGYDCSVKLEELNLNSINNQTIASNSWKFFYLEFPSQASTFSIKFSKKTGNPNFYFTYNDISNSLPSMFESDMAFWFTNGNNEFTYISGVININSLKLSLFCHGEEMCEIELSFEFDSDNSELSKSTCIIIITISVVLFFSLCFMFTAIIRVYIRHRNTARVQSENSAINPLSGIGIQILFPSKKWSNLNKNSETCAICLDDFLPKSLIRLLECEHYFHVKCIDEWASNNIKCPLCKQNMVAENITTFSTETVLQTENNEFTERRIERLFTQ